MVKPTTVKRPRPHFPNAVTRPGWRVCSPRAVWERIQEPAHWYRVESFTTHKHLVLHAPRECIGAVGPDARRAESRSRGSEYNSRARTVIRHPAALHRHPTSPAAAAPCNHIAARRGTPRVTVHTQNRYVLINVWTWCRAEASLPPIRLIVLQSFCCAVVPRILFTCMHASASRSRDYAISADNQACRFTAGTARCLPLLGLGRDYS